MTNLLKTSSKILYYSFLLLACNSTSNENEAKALKTDTSSTITTTVAVAVPEPVPVLFKETVLTEKTMIGNKRLSTAAKTSKEDFKALSLKVIDSTAVDAVGFKYHIVDTLFSKPGLKILLIGREYESENIVWIAIYDGQNTLLDHKTIYYDNAEGFMSVETTIKKDELTITSFNEYAEQEKDKKTIVTYRLSEHNRFIKK